MNILTKRPEGMSFENYKKHLRAQKYWIESYIKNGKMIHHSSTLEIERDAVTGIIKKQTLSKNPVPYRKNPNAIRR